MAEDLYSSVRLLQASRLTMSILSDSFVQMVSSQVFGVSCFPSIPETRKGIKVSGTDHISMVPATAAPVLLGL